MLLKDLLLNAFFVCVARVVTDRVTGYSRGFGFVKYANLEGAANGIKGMDGKVLVYIYFLELLFFKFKSGNYTKVSAWFWFKIGIYMCYNNILAFFFFKLQL